MFRGIRKKLLKHIAFYRRRAEKKFNKAFYTKEELLEFLPPNAIGKEMILLCGRERILEAIIPKHSVGLEIGVWEGTFSKKIMSVVKPAFLYLVDTWMFQPEYAFEWYGGILKESQANMDEMYNQVKKDLAGEKTSILRMTSDDFFVSFAQKNFTKVDWVYIDGNHLYDFVLRDLNGASSIIKEDGIIWGDDFYWKPPHLKYRPVKDAVIQFCKENNKKYIVIDEQFVIL